MGLRSCCISTCFIERLLNFLVKDLLYSSMVLSLQVDYKLIRTETKKVLEIFL